MSVIIRLVHSTHLREPYTINNCPREFFDVIKSVKYFCISMDLNISLVELSDELQLSVGQRSKDSVFFFFFYPKCI